MFKSNLKLSKDLLERTERCAKTNGYSSLQEFVEHVLEKEVAKVEEAESNEKIAKSLKGLGYLE